MNRNLIYFVEYKSVIMKDKGKKQKKNKTVHDALTRVEC